ncbi:MAG: methyltransferase [Nanoarchaeota archaeon]|nr:methyltransferase [Nanoarchaeota archaeon]
MQALVVTSKGAEEICLKEIQEIAKVKNAKIGNSIVIFDTKEEMQLCEICYRSQTISKAMALFSEFIVSEDIEVTLENLRSSVNSADLKAWLSSEKTCRTACIRSGEHGFTSVDIEINAASLIKETAIARYDIRQKTDIDDPTVIFLIIIHDDKGYFGVDFSGIDLSKRQYKVFNHPESLKGTTGGILAAHADISPGMTIIDPFMGSGVIPIELGLKASGISPHYYSREKLAFTNFDFFKREGFFESQKETEIGVFGFDNQLRFLKATQKNAKLAGVEKYMKLSKIDLEWVDLKFEKASVDMIITDPPRQAKTKNPETLEKIYDEFFSQAAILLKKKGKIILFTRDYDLIEKAALNHKFKITQSHSIFQGKETFNIINFERGK